MEAILIFPPCGDFSQPPIGIAQIAGYVRQHKKEIKLMDFSIETIGYFLTSEYLRKCYEIVAARLREFDGIDLTNESSHKPDGLLKSKRKEYSRLASAYFYGEYVISHVEEALEQVKKIETYEHRENYEKSACIIEKAMELVAVSHKKIHWNYSMLEFVGSMMECDNVVERVLDEEGNFLIPFYKHLFPRIAKEEPKVVGISISYLSQLIPALTLARIVKEKLPACKIIFGGALFQVYATRLDIFSRFQMWLDGIIPFAGEHVWLEILEALQVGNTFEHISGLVWKKKGHFDQTEKLSMIPVTRVLPDYSDFPMEKYLTPFPILPYILAAGCYWGKCAFCCYPHCNTKIGIDHRTRTLVEIIEDLCYLQKMYHTNHFYFVDEALPPLLMEQLSEYIAENHLDLKWAGEIRFDAPLVQHNFIEKIKAGGCELLLFGLESGVQRVLDRMHKGTKVENISKIFQECEKHHLNSFVMFFIGFPTETRQEALQTIEFIEKHKQGIQYISYGSFRLLRHTYVHENPQEYQLQVVKSSQDLTYYDTYKIKEGMSAKEADIFVKKIHGYEGLKDCMDYPLISRNHLGFFKERHKIEPRLEQVAIDETAYPNVLEHVVIKDLKKSLTADRFDGTKDSYHYIINLKNNIYYQVDDFILHLITQCRNHIPLQEITKDMTEKETYYTTLLCEKFAKERIVEWKTK